VKIKVCGITNPDDALAAADLGADAVGFIFVHASPRYISPRAAGMIIRRLPASVLPVGVFADAARQEIADAVAEAGVRTIQLHGHEPPVEAEGYPVPVWKAFGVDDLFHPEDLARFRVAAFLLDSRRDGWTGGPRVPFDWQRAVKAKPYGDIVLAGGLTPDNIVQAATIVRPYAIDVNSGVERSPGRKDHEKLRLLIESVRSLNY
jgi:phosphoribosylanthranilate isomerase